MQDVATNFMPVPKSTNLAEQVESSRAVAEVQAAYIIAKKFPRDQHQAYLNIVKACERPFLAEQGQYAYPKGGKVVTGPSIRLAEVLAQNWGNMDFGIRELSQENGVSLAEAFAVDLETNTRSTKVFHVPHSIHTKNGTKKLTDPRDIYELVANQGSRRMRACILAVIPGDIVEGAVEQCQKTLVNGKEPIADTVRKLVGAFSTYGVLPAHIEKRLGHNLDAVIPEELVTLRAMYKSIKDGMAKREDFFAITTTTPADERIAALIAEKNTVETPKPDNPEMSVGTEPVTTKTDYLKAKNSHASSSQD